MLINMRVPYVPQNVMIRHNNHFVPTEKEFVVCQPFANTAGYQCEFSLDKMMLESNKTNVEIWANFGEYNDGTLRLGGQQDASKCNADEEGQAHCDTKLVINSDQIDQLKNMSMDEVMMPFFKAIRTPKYIDDNWKDVDSEKKVGKGWEGKFCPEDFGERTVQRAYEDSLRRTLKATASSGGP
ncbi:hypothetical protein GPALN_010364 [Globodera pallida]|nr:hypothetical protein GPALN_010364 [Globodera pallida]